MKIFASIILIVLSVSMTKADQFAVIVAGSKGYYNYRHQASACHAYNSFVAGGIKANNIITFIHNDIHDSSMNPTPEFLYNKKDGADVYKKCVIDYQKQDHSAKNFLAVLRGDKEAIGNAGSQRVLNTIGSDSKIFIAFIGDAAPGILNFPNSTL